MRKITVATIALALTLGAIGGALALIPGPPPARVAIRPTAAAVASALLAEPAPAPPPAVRDIVVPNTEILGVPAHHPGAARGLHRLNCGDWQDLHQGPAASKVRRCN